MDRPEAPALPRNRLLSMFTVMALLVALAACGGDAEPEEGDDEGVTTTAGGAEDGGECDGYPSENIRLVVPYNPGGAMDLWGRFSQQALEASLPNEATVIVDNRPGAGGMIGTTAVYTSDADGYTIGLVDPAQVKTVELQGNSDIDVTTMRAIGRLTLAPEIVVVSSASEAETIEDLQALASERPLIMSTGGVAAVNIVSFDALDMPFEALNHDGSAEALLALQRGDGDVSVFTLANMIQGIRAGDFRPLLVIGTRPAEGEPGYEEIGQVPTLDEATGQEGLGASLEQNRMLWAPPGTPDCVVDILSEAMVTGVSDPDFLASVEEAGEFPPSPLNAADAQEIINNISEQLTQYQELLTQLEE
jgi:tripartite-type tricarboxylate transporter receptor subunit TctC